MKNRPAWPVANEAFYTYLVKPYANVQFEALASQARAA
jgi:hypothetical protein